MNSLKDRMIFALTHSEKTKSDLWKHCKISSGTVSLWFNGTTKTIGGRNLICTAAYLGVNPDWLATGNGSPFGLHEPATNQQGIINIPQYLDVSGAMGNGLTLRDQPGQITGWRVTQEWANKNIPSNTGKENLCIVTGFGDSMRGMFNSGDPLIIDAGVRELKFDGVYFFRVGDEGFIKRLQRIPGNGIRVISKNPDYETWTITPDMDFEIFGRVLKVWKSEDF